MSRVVQYRGSGLLALSCVLVAALCSIVGCGGGAANGKPNPSSLSLGGKRGLNPKSIQACLRHSGASFPSTIKGINFFLEAKLSDEASNFGIAFDQTAGVVVELWEKAIFENHPSEWLMWVGQPFDKNRSPVQIIRSNPPRSYVAYVLRPTSIVRRRTQNCIQFEPESSKPPPTILDRSDFEDGEPE
jgi:hypothetical protein